MTQDSQLRASVEATVLSLLTWRKLSLNVFHSSEDEEELQRKTSEFSVPNHWTAHNSPSTMTLKRNYSPCETAYRGRPLTVAQQMGNRSFSASRGQERKKNRHYRATSTTNDNVEQVRVLIRRLFLSTDVRTSLSSIPIFIFSVSGSFKAPSSHIGESSLSSTTSWPIFYTMYYILT